MYRTKKQKMQEYMEGKEWRKDGGNGWKEWWLYRTWKQKNGWMDGW